MFKTLSLRAKLIIATILPMLAVGIGLFFTLETLETSNLDRILSTRMESYQRTWETLVKARGELMTEHGSVIRQNKELVQSLKSGNRQIIADMNRNVWNQLMRQADILFYWNSARQGERVLFHVGGASNFEGDFSSPFLENVSESKKASHALGRSPDGLIRLLQATPYFSAPGKPYNLAVLGVNLDPLLAELKEIARLKQATIDNTPGLSNETPSWVQTEASSLVVFRIPLIDVGGNPLAHLVLEEEITPILADFQQSKMVALAIPLFLLILGTLGMLIFSGTLVRRIRVMTDLLSALSAGDVTQRLTISPHPDELERISLGINGMASSLTDSIQNVVLQSNSTTVLVKSLATFGHQVGQDAASGMQVVEEAVDGNRMLDKEVAHIKESVAKATNNIQAVDETVNTLSGHVHTVAAAAEEASLNANTVASAAEEMHVNVQSVNNSLVLSNEAVNTVSSLMDRIAQSLEEVRSRCIAAERESRAANSRSKEAVRVMESLAQSAQEIQTVVEMIQNIADQTNMLSLNAAIEAAGAGHAGRGFAVVAGEIKELARQTLESSSKIAERIHLIQTRSREAAHVVEEVGQAMTRMEEANGGILLAVEEQGRAIGHSSESMSRVTHATREVTRHAQELDQASREVARSIGEVSEGMNEIARASGNMASATQAAVERTGEARRFTGEILVATGKTQQFSLTVRDKMETARAVVKGLTLSVLHVQRLARQARIVSDALFAAHVGLDTGPAPFDILRVKESHFALVDHLDQSIRRAAQGEKENPTPTCLFDQWLGTGSEREDQEAIRLHGLFHRETEQALSWLRQGDLPRAESHLAKVMESLEDFFATLDRLYLGHDASREGLAQWSDALTTGIAEMDEDHGQLVGLINGIYGQLRCETDPSREMLGMGQMLRTFAREHFSREEAFMEKIGYPGLTEHQQAHQQMLETVDRLMDHMEAGQTADTSEVLRFLLVWLHGHVRRFDLPYALHARTQGRKKGNSWRRGMVIQPMDLALNT